MPYSIMQHNSFRLLHELRDVDDYLIFQKIMDWFLKNLN